VVLAELERDSRCSAACAHSQLRAVDGVEGGLRPPPPRRGDLVVTLDGIAAREAEIPGACSSCWNTDPGRDVVSGWRKQVRTALSRRIPAWFATA